MKRLDIVAFCKTDNFIYIQISSFGSDGVSLVGLGNMRGGLVRVRGKCHIYGSHFPDRPSYTKRRNSSVGNAYSKTLNR